MWPSFRWSLERRLNTHLLQRAVRRALPPRGSAIGVTTIPLTADLVGRQPLDRWIYYCVDDLSEWPGLDRSTLLDMERKLVERADEIVVVSQALEGRIEAMGRRATLLTHGVDLDHWRSKSIEPLQRFASLEPPLVVFWGVTDQRLAVDWLEELDRRLERGTVVLVGPTNNPDPRIAALQRVRLETPVSYQDLPRLAASAMVLIMPYRDLPATRAMQPLKLKEYLATNRPVVVSSLPAVEPWKDACDVVASAEGFAGAVIRRFDTGLSTEQASARERLRNETWQHKAAAFERLILSRDSP